MSAAVPFITSALALHSSITYTRREALKRRSCNVMPASPRMLNQGWSKQLDAIQLDTSSPDCSFFSNLANSSAPAIRFPSLSLQLANSLSSPPRTGVRGGEGAVSILENLSGMLGGVASVEADVIHEGLWGQQRLGHTQGGSSLRSGLARPREAIRD